MVMVFQFNYFYHYENVIFVFFMIIYFFTSLNRLIIALNPLLIFTFESALCWFLLAALSIEILIYICMASYFWVIIGPFKKYVVDSLYFIFFWSVLFLIFYAVNLAELKLSSHVKEGETSAQVLAFQLCHLSLKSSLSMHRLGVRQGFRWHLYTTCMTSPSVAISFLGFLPSFSLRNPKLYPLFP